MAWTDSKVEVRRVVPGNRDGDVVLCVPASQLGLNVLRGDDIGTMVHLILTCPQGSTAIPLTDEQVEWLKENLDLAVGHAKSIRQGGAS